MAKWIVYVDGSGDEYDPVPLVVEAHSYKKVGDDTHVFSGAKRDRAQVKITSGSIVRVDKEGA